jgi:putative DNA primase/helicase
MTRPTDKPKYPTFAQVKDAALRAIDSVLSHWLPAGKRVDGGKEYTAPNPTRADKRAGSLKVNLAKGAWSDFATGAKGGDLIDLVRYLDGGTDVEACNKLADFLNVTATSSAAPISTSKAKAADWVAVLPIPADAMQSIPAKHYKHGKPSKLWIYKDAAAQPLFVLYRFDLGPDADGKRRKVFAPLTWCASTADGTLQWRWQGLIEARPLLRLDQLAQRNSAPVVVCEGEKSADATAELLPDHVATCWPNGSNAWQKADFAPLTGRDVLLWPDNDAPGLTCMLALAEHLRQHGAASVRMVAMACFSQQPCLTDGQATLASGGDWAAGDDAADALAKGWTPAHLAELVRSGELFAPAPAGIPASTSGTSNDPAKPTADKSPAKPASSRKAPAKPKPKTDTLPGGFRVTADGVFYAGDDGEARPVCSYLMILARTRDDTGRNWGLLVEFDDPDGSKKRWNIPARSMAGDFGKEVLGPLVDMGLRLAGSRSGRNTRNDLQSYLQGFDSAERARLVTRLGWHGDAYLLPDQQIGETSEHLHFYEAGTPLPPIGQAGTLEQWQQQIGALCVDNHRVAFAVCIAFAGPLLHLLGQGSGGFHFYGASSTGKSTTGRVACSVYGPPAFERSWRSTDNALESIAAAHSDGLLVLDEISQCDPRIIGETIYMLGNGQGKSRANDRGQAGRQAQEWRVLFLSSGEHTLAQHMAEAHKELKAGMEVRMLAIAADTGKGHGVFDSLHGFASGAALSDALQARVGKFYGSPLVAFLQALCEPYKLRGYVAILRTTLEGFAAKALPATASGQAHRAVTRFALAAAAGELATALGVTGWPDGTATAAARACFKAWLAERGGAGNLEGDAIVDRLRLVIERDGESRFTRWDAIAAKTDEHGPRTVNRLGFRRTMQHGLGDDLYTTVTYYFLPGAWRDDVFRGLNIRDVNKTLITRGILTPHTDGKSSQPLDLPGLGKSRAYVVAPGAQLSRETEDLAA